MDEDKVGKVSWGDVGEDKLEMDVKEDEEKAKFSNGGVGDDKLGIVVKGGDDGFILLIIIMRIVS